MLFHRVPKNLIGTELMPLNRLRTEHPEVYKSAVKKYHNRPHVPQNYIPQLDCTWGDVLFFAAVPPSVLLQTLRKNKFPKWEPMPSYEVPLDCFDPKRLIVCYPNQAIQPYYTYFYANDLPRYAKITGVTTKYYRHCAEKGERPLLFNGIVHILYAGSLDVTGLRVVV